MSDELDTVAKVGGIAGGGGAFVAFGVWLAKRFVRKSDEAEAREKADMKATLAHLMLSKENHREQLEDLKRKVVELDTRLGFREGRYGVEPLTTPGTKPSPLVAALQAKARGSNDGE